MEIGRRLKEILINRNISQYRLSKLSDVPQSTISSLIHGAISNPSSDLLIKLSSALNLSISELLGTKEIIIENIKLVMDQMSAKEFADLIGNPGITENSINFYLNGDIEPEVGSLYIIAESLGIDYTFFYNVNTKESLEQAKKEYKNKQNTPTSLTLSEQEKNLILKVRDKNLDVKFLDNMIDLVSSQIEKQK